MLKATLCIPEHSRIDNSLQLTEEKKIKQINEELMVVQIQMI